MSHHQVQAFDGAPLPTPPPRHNTSTTSTKHDPNKEDFTLPLGTIIGDWVLVRVVGEGRTGILYAAHHRSDPSNEKAIKIFRGSCHRDQFDLEVANLEEVGNKSPSQAQIVRKEDSFEDCSHGGCCCLVLTPLCESNLAKRLDKKDYDLPTALKWATQVAETLQMVHMNQDYRLFHGDVAAENVLLYQDDAYLHNFGFLGHHDRLYNNHHHENHHREGHHCHEPCEDDNNEDDNHRQLFHSSSIAPELRMGDRALDNTADIWSWGVLLLRLLLRRRREDDDEAEEAFFRSVSEGTEVTWPARVRAAWEEEGVVVPEEAIAAVKGSVVSRHNRQTLGTLMKKLERALGKKESSSLVLSSSSVSGLSENDQYLEEWQDVVAECDEVLDWLDDMQPDDILGEALVLHRKGKAHYELGQPAQAQSCLMEAIDEMRALPKTTTDDLEFACCLCNLAQVYVSMNQFRAALPLYEEALDIKQKELGPYSTDVAKCLNKLAMVYENMKEYGQAIPMYELALTINRRALGPNHPLVPTSLRNLSTVYSQMGEHVKALTLCQEALDMQKEVVGADRLELVDTLLDLAAVYVASGNYLDALHVHDEILSIRKEALGLEHLDVAASYTSIAYIYDNKLREVEKALELYEQALTIMTKCLDANHPDIATCMNSMGRAYSILGEYEKALALYQRALNIRRIALGPDDPDVATSLSNLAYLYGNMEQHDKSVPFFEEALAIMKEVLGEEHPTFAMTLASLGLAYQRMGETDKALTLCKQALAMLQDTMGQNSTATATALNYLGLVYQSRGEIAQAVPLFEESLCITRNALGADATGLTYSDSLEQLASVYIGLKEEAKALGLYQELLEYQRRVLGPDDVEVGDTLYDLAALYTSMGEADKAKEAEQEAQRIHSRAEEEGEQQSGGKG